MVADGRPTPALDDLAIFVAVAQQASFVEASRRLRVPTSSVSRAVARLEESLGVLLLRRTSRHVGLTEEGRQLQLQASVHVEGLEEALGAAADRHPEPAGTLRVTAPAYTGSTRVARSLARFAATYPKVIVELDATNAFRDLIQDGFDFGIRLGPHVHPDFVGRRLWEGRFGLFASKDFVKGALGGHKTVTRETLESAECVVLRTKTTWRFRSEQGGTTEIEPRARFSVNDPRGAIDVARLGVGITLVPLDAVTHGDRQLVHLQAEFGEPEPLLLHAVYPSRRLLPSRVRLAIDWLAKDDGE